MKVPTNGFSANSGEAEKKVINSELWHACAGPLVCLPPVGSLIVYFPQGHSEQVAATMQKEADSIPSYPNLPSKLICMLHNITLHADGETDEVYAQMTLQPVTKYGQEALLVSDLAPKQSRHPTEFFCKTLTASDTSTHGGFSVPRRAAEKIFPPLDFTLQPPAQELSATDLHDQTWTFRHIYRGQPKRHLLTTGWSIFVSSKRLVAGDAVLFIRDEKSRLLLGLRRPNRLQPPLSSSVISSDSMHIGILAAAAHASANNSPFTVFYNPRASPSDFVIPLAKYNKAMYTQVSSGMRFRMMFETEDSGVRRHMGTVTSISDLDPVRWKSSQWRNLQVGWDESTAGERPSRVSIWDIEPVITPFYICPQPFFRPKFSTLAGLQDDNSDMENMFRRNVPWLVDDFGPKGSSNSIFPGLSLVQWMSMQQQLTHPNQPGFFPPMPSSMDDPSKLLNFQSPGPPLSSQFQQNKPNSDNARQLSQVVQPNSAWSQPQQIAQSPILTPRQQLPQSQPMVLPPGASGSTAPDQMANWNLQPAAAFQLTQQTGPDLTFCTRVDQPSSLERRPHGQQVQMQKVETFRALQQSLARRVTAQPLTPQQNLSEQPLQMQDLQKLHQQQQQQQQRSPQLPPEKQQAQQPNGKHFPTQNQIQCQQKAPVLANQSLIHTDGDAPTSSTWPSTSVNILRSNFLKNHCLLENTAAHLPNPAQEIYNRADELADQPAKYRVVTGVSHVDAMSSSTSYCPDTSGVLRQSFPMNNGLNGGANNGLGFGLAGVDGLAPDALLSRGYGGNSSDVEPELSPIDSQLFRVPNVPFGGGCSNDSPVNEMVVLSGGGMWPSQTQRMRTFTKVQKRGSVGRTIDVTRYKGYDELRNDLARMFGIEGLLEDPQRTQWKLVYIDHENDILLVGDDPWEEFVSCVQSIKILSLVEVQQMSLDGDLGTHFDDNSSTSFNR